MFRDLHQMALLAACGFTVAAAAPAWGEVEVVLRPVAQSGIDFTASVRLDSLCPPAINNNREYAFAYQDDFRRRFRYNERMLLSYIDAPLPTSGFDLADTGVLVWSACCSFPWPAGVYMLERGGGPPTLIASGGFNYADASVNEQGSVAYIQYETPFLRFPSGRLIQLTDPRTDHLDLNNDHQVIMLLSNVTEPLALWQDGVVETHVPPPLIVFGNEPWPILSLNDHGEVAFYSNRSRGLIVAGPPDALQVAVEPDLFIPPGSPPSTLTRVLNRRPHLAESGDVAFMGEDLLGHETLYLKDSAGVHRIAGRGDLVELAAGTREILQVELAGHFAANDRGDVLFTALLGDPALPGFWTDRAVLLAHVQPNCVCELTGDAPAAVDELDLLAFVNLWFQKDVGADLTVEAPSHVDVHDLLAYLDCWFIAVGGDCH